MSCLAYHRGPSQQYFDEIENDFPAHDIFGETALLCVLYRLPASDMVAAKWRRQLRLL